jgi:putative Holliday junction resolvase
LKTLCVDHGDKRIGIAVSDELAMFARPHSILEHVSRESDASSVVTIAQELGCERIVVGMPFDSDGSIGPRARTILRFIESLKAQTRLAVIPWDESHSTQNTIRASILRGEKSRQRRKAMDDQAAAVILQDFLDASNPFQPGDTHES